MAEEENFGYSLSLPELTKDDLTQTLHKEIIDYKKNGIFSFLGANVIPYIADKCSGKFSFPWEGAIYSSLILFEMLAVGTCLYSVHKWRQTSKKLGGLEEKL